MRLASKHRFSGVRWEKRAIWVGLGLKMRILDSNRRENADSVL